MLQRFGWPGKEEAFSLIESLGDGAFEVYDLRTYRSTITSMM